MRDSIITMIVFISLGVLLGLGVFNFYNHLSKEGVQEETPSLSVPIDISHNVKEVCVNGLVYYASVYYLTPKITNMNHPDNMPKPRYHSC